MKKLARWIALAVLVAWLVSDPAAAAHAAHGAIGWLTHAASALSTFASNL
ncbi:MAG: hypothetical protein M0030_18760 [Actinomycetota bacterium]|nr:hypothetical protein [Actinomycetota bacterium]